MLSRRQFLKLLGLGAASAAISIPSIQAQQTALKTVAAPPGQPVAFTDDEYQTLVAAAEVIVPGGDGAPGATVARVADYLDAQAASSPAFLARYQEGLRWLDEASVHHYGGKPFVHMLTGQQIALFQEAERTMNARTRPVKSVLDRVVQRVNRIWDDLFGLGGGATFFITLRDDVFEGFYTSRAAWEMLKYDGPPQYQGYPDYADKCTGKGAEPRLKGKGVGLAAPSQGWFEMDIEIPYAFGGLPAQEAADE